MRKLRPNQLNFAAWGLSLIATVLAITAWAQRNDWEVAAPSIYKLFPLLGLLAFSLMWGHYIVAALRKYYGVDKSAVSLYFESTSHMVLVLILLHPGLLIWKLWRDDFGLPPESIKSYVSASGYWAAVIAIIALTAFLAYELRRKFSDKQWWKYVQYASDAAMFLIFIHAIRLGSTLQISWFRGVWYFYGVTLAASLIYMYSKANRVDKYLK